MGFPGHEDDADAKRAVAIRRGCPVRDECLSHAMATNNPAVISGGASQVTGGTETLCRTVHCYARPCQALPGVA